MPYASNALDGNRVYFEDDGGNGEAVVFYGGTSKEPLLEEHERRVVLDGLRYSYCTPTFQER